MLFCPRQVTRQFLRYSVVGIASNAIGYSSFLIVTSIGVSPVKGMTIVYICACLASFAGNKQWAFGDATQTRKLFPRYVAIQVIGYVTNLFLLLLLHKQLGFPYQWIQLLAFALVATELFILSKYYVFRGAQNRVRP